MSALTREQVEWICGGTSALPSTLERLLAHDQAQRDQLARLEQERDIWMAAADTSAGQGLFWCNRVTELEAQLAAREARMAKLEEALKYIAHFTREDLDNAKTLHYDMAGIAQQALHGGW